MPGPGSLGPGLGEREKTFGVTAIFKVWLILFAIQLSARPLITYWGFRHFDLRDVAFAQIVAVPAMLALVLGWPGSPEGFQGEWRKQLRRIRRNRPLLWLAGLDLLLLGTGWLAAEDSWLSFGRRGGLLDFYSGGKTFAAGCWILFRRTGANLSAADRFVLRAGGAALVFLASDHFLPWISLLPDLFPARWGILLRWAAGYGIPFLAGMFLLTRAQIIARRYSRAAGWFLGIACITASAAALIRIVGSYNSPDPAPFWYLTIRTGGFLALSAIVYGILEPQVAEPDPAPPVRGRLWWAALPWPLFYLVAMAAYWIFSEILSYGMAGYLDLEAESWAAAGLVPFLQVLALKAAGRWVDSRHA